MDLTLILKAVLIGLVEGLTEFLPVSSTGHIILAEEVLHFEGPQGKVFEIVIQLGAILAVCLALPRQDLRHDRSACCGAMPASMRFATAVIVAFLPAAVIGVALHKYIKTDARHADRGADRAHRGRHRHPDHRALAQRPRIKIGRRHRLEDRAVRRLLPVPRHDPRRLALGRHHHGRAGSARGSCDGGRVLVLPRHADHARGRPSTTPTRTGRPWTGTAAA